MDEQPDLAAEFGVMSIPTLLVFQNGKLVNQSVGARPKSGVLALLGYKRYKHRPALCACTERGGVASE